MPILIPRHLATALRRPILPMFGVYFTLQQVANRTATVADLTHALAKLRRSDVIRWLAAISGWIDDDGVDQPKLADTLLAPDLWKGLDEHLRREPNIPGRVFHRRQLWFVLQMAVIACKEDTPEQPEDVMRHAVGECCLIANEILQRIEKKEGPGEGAEEVNKWLASTMVPLLELKDRAEILARAQSFWFDLPAKAAVQKKVSEMGVPDYDTAFSDTYGIPLREFFLLLMSVYSGFSGHSLHSKAPLLLDEATYLRPCFSEENIRRVLSHLSQTPDELADNLLSEARQNWSMDFTPLRRAPVIQVFPGKYACPDQGLLYRCICDGIYFLMQKAYAENKFTELFGYVFEEYVNGLVREFSCESDILVRTFFASPKFRGTTDQAGDGLILRDDTAVLMEYKSRLLTTRQKYGGIREVTLKGIDDILYKDKKGVAQLARNLARILRGERIVSGPGEGVDLSHCPHIYPAIVAYEESVALEAIRQRADANLRHELSKEGVDPGRVGPLLVFCLDDMEILEELAHKHNVRDVIHNYVDYVLNNPKDRAGHFRSYVYNSAYSKGDSSGQAWVERTFHRAMEEVSAEAERRQPAAKARDDKSRSSP